MNIVVIGGGAIGSSIAYHLAIRRDLAASITVVERDPTYARASSVLSASSIREQFSTPVNIAMSQFGLRFLRAAPDALMVDDECPDLSLRLGGYLFLASEAGRAILRDNHRVQRAAGADVALLSPQRLRERFPWLCGDGVVEASLGLSREGWFDGPGLLAALRRKARALGVIYVPAVASGLARAGTHVGGVRLADGSLLACDIAVNAAGAWAGAVAAWAGLDLPIRPRKRMVYVLECRDDLPACPLVIDPSGVWFRPEGRFFLTGRSPAADEPDPDEPPLDVDEATFTDIIWPILAARVPAFESVRIRSSWAGYYEMNLFDGNGIVGAHPAVPNLIHAAGFSGHGMQHSPAVGRGVAELIATGGYDTLDLAPLGTVRLIANRPLIERNIV